MSAGQRLIAEFIVVVSRRECNNTSVVLVITEESLQ